jgi:hypothetical protein
MKIVCNSFNKVTVWTTFSADIPAAVKQIVGVGNPYWAWASIPAGKVIGADFTNAPICSSDLTQIASDIAAITALPNDVLTYQ